MKKFLIWLVILILAVALGVLGYKAPGPLENLSNNYRLGLMVGGIVFLLMDFVWAFLKVRGWWKRREEAGKEEWDEEDYEEGEQSVGWDAMPVLIPQQSVSPTPSAPSAPVSPPPQSPAKEEEGKGNAWGKWLIAGAVVLAIVVGVGLAAITSGSGSQSTVIAGRPAATQQRTLQPTQRGLGVQVSAQEKEQPTGWFLVIIPYALWLGICVGLWQFWAEITRPEEFGPLKLRFNFRGGGSAQVDVKLIIHGRFDPASLWRQQMVGLDEASSVMIGIVSEQVRSQTEDLSVFDYQRVKVWEKEINRALADRVQNVTLTEEQERLIEFLALQEDRTGYEVTQIVLGTLELDAAANQRLREHQETEAGRQRVAGVSGLVAGVVIPTAASLTLAQEFIAFCTETGLERNESTLREWITLQRDTTRAEVEKMEAQAASIRAQALSEISDIDFDRLVDSIARIVEGVVVGRSAR